MAKFKPGDKVKSSVDGKTYIAMEESRPGYWWLADLDGRGNGLETREIDLTLANSRACNGVRSRNAVVAKALNACGTARNALDQAAVSRALTDAVRAVGVLQRVAQDNSDERQAKIAQKAKSVLLGEI